MRKRLGALTAAMVDKAIPIRRTVRKAHFILRRERGGDFFLLPIHGHFAQPVPAHRAVDIFGSNLLPGEEAVLEVKVRVRRAAP